MLCPACKRWRLEGAAVIATLPLSVPATLSVSRSAAAQPAGESRVISGPGIDAGAGTLPGALVLAYQNILRSTPSARRRVQPMRTLTRRSPATGRA